MSIPDLPLNTTLKGRSVLITGSNVGLGYHASLLALQLGASPLYITARTAEKGNKTRQSLLADPVVMQRNPDAIVKPYELEMSTWEGVKSFASKFIADRKTAGEGLDIVILNAGMVNLDFELAPTGNEAVLQVNTLSSALLSLLLLPLLESSTTPEHTARLTIISSTSHTLVTDPKQCPPSNINYLASLNDKKTFNASAQYGLSKLLLIFFLRELSTKVIRDKVIINNVCPDWIKTDLIRKAPWYMSPYVWWLHRNANPIEKGAACYIDAVANVGKESHGLWYQRMKLTPYAPLVTSQEGEKLQKRIWDETMEVLEKAVPGVSANV